MIQDLWKIKYTARILGGQQFTGIHSKVDEWVSNNPDVHYDKTSGISYINGVTYHSSLVFPNEEDLLAFKLTFAGFVV